MRNFRVTVKGRDSSENWIVLKAVLDEVEVTNKKLLSKIGIGDVIETLLAKKVKKLEIKLNGKVVFKL